MPSLLFQTHLAVPTRLWQVVQSAEGCAAVSQLMVGVTAAADLSAGYRTCRGPTASRSDAASPRDSQVLSPPPGASGHDPNSSTSAGGAMMPAGRGPAEKRRLRNDPSTAVP